MATAVACHSQRLTQSDTQRLHTQPRASAANPSNEFFKSNPGQQPTISPIGTVDTQPPALLAACPQPSLGAGQGWLKSLDAQICCGYSERARLETPGFVNSSQAQCLAELAPGLKKVTCFAAGEPLGIAAPGESSGASARIDDPILEQLAFDAGKSELTPQARIALDAVHRAYVRGSCGWAMIAAYLSTSESRHKDSATLLRERAAAVQAYLIQAGIPEQNARDFGRDDFLSAAMRKRVEPAQASALVYCPAPRAPERGLNGQCASGCDETCTPGATLRLVIPDADANVADMNVCLRDKCSASNIDLRSLSVAPRTTLVARMQGLLPAALVIVQEPGFRPIDLAWGERVRGFFIEIRAGIGLSTLTDGDAYTVRVSVNGRERPELSMNRNATYRDWVPCLKPTQSCKDASFPAKYHWPLGPLRLDDTEF